MDSPERVDDLKEVLEKLEGISSRIPSMKIQRPDRDVLFREFDWVIGMLRHACRRGIWAAGRKNGEEDLKIRNQLIRESESLIHEFDGIWHARNRPGGYADSQARMIEMREAYL